jgi:flagellar basal body P-ring formation protein FlgA
MSAIRAGLGCQFKAVPAGRAGTVPAVTPPRLPPLRPALAAALCCLAGPALAQADALAQAQRQAVALATQAARALAPAAARVAVEPGTLDARLQLAPCERIEPFLPPGAVPWGAARVGLRCARGAVAWQAWLPVKVQVFAPALVARSALSAGSRLDATQFTLAEVDWAAAPGLPLAQPADVDQRLLARPLRPGQALRSGDLRARQWFAAGDAVVLVALGSGFTVNGEGVALDAGVQGRPARVRTPSGRVLSVRPVAERRAEVVL